MVPVHRVTIVVDGWVQGVGFRWWVSRQAGRLGLAGGVENLPDGRVRIDVQGLPSDVEAMVQLAIAPAVRGRPGHVSDSTVSRREPDQGLTDFTVR